MNNHDENKKYFKSTFKVFHVPDNIAKEVLDMAKKLNQEDNTNSIKNTNQETVSYQAENVSHHNFGRWIAIACACVLVVGSGLYFNNLGSEDIATQLEDNCVSLGQSTQADDKLFGRFDMPSQVDAKLLAHSSENSDITSYLTSQDLTKLNPLINYENWIEVSTYPAEFDNDVMYPYFAEIDFQTNDDEYIRLEIVDQYVFIYHTDENYEHYSNVEYYQYDFNNDISFFETFKQLLENNATQQVDTVQNSTYTNFMGMFNANNITISYQQKDKNNYTINDLSKSNISANDVNLINSTIDLNTCTKIDEDTFHERNPKYNENLLNSDINLDNASIKFTEGNKLFNIYIVNDVMIITHFNSNGEIRLYDGYYSIENTNLLDTINSIVNVDDVYNTDGNQEIQYGNLFGVIDIPINVDFIGSNMYGDISVNGYLNDDFIEEFNELSNVSEWIETDLSSIGDDINIVIDISSTPSDRTFKTAYNFIIQDNVAMVTQNDGSQKCYIVPDTLAYDMLTILNESNIENQVDSSKLFGIIPMDENTSFSAVISSSTGGESACILNYQDLIKINELSCYDMWQQLTNNPISQDFYYETCVSLKNDNYSIQILDTTIIVTYPDGTLEYYSTMETCGTDTFAQSVQSLVYERSRTQIID